MNRSTILLKVLYIIVLVLLTMNLFAKNYYVNSLSSSSIADGSFANPWKTTADVNNANYLLNPGDTVFFKRGGVYTGSLYCNKSGTAAQPVVYTAYGTGNMPELTHTTTNVIVIYFRQFIVIDGLKIIDKTMNPTDHSITAKIGYGIVIHNAPYNKVKNCDVSLVGIGIDVGEGSNFTEIKNNYIHDLRIIKNTIGGGEDDFGANGILVSSYSNSIVYNKFERCWAYSYDFGRDGGAIEFFNTNMSENIIMYNVANECIGFLEVASLSNAYAINNLIAYNKIINCGPIGVFHNLAGVQVKVYNTKYFNNVIICTNKDFVYGSVLFWMADNTEVDVINFRNNIVWLTTGFSFQKNDLYPDRIIHKNNIYHIINGGSLGIELDSTEYRNGLEHLFVDTTNVDPMKWDLHLRSNAAGINFGEDVGIVRDFDSTLITDGKPDAGVYEYISPEPVKFEAVVSLDSLIKCNGDITTITVSATNGTPPYIGTGTFYVMAGSYNYIVADAKGLKDTVSIILSEPAPLVLTLSAGTTPTSTDSTRITAIATGGISPYLFKLDNGNYQSNNVFYNIFPGNYEITVKDSNTCLETKAITIIFTAVTNLPSKKFKISVYPNPSNYTFTLASIRYKGTFLPIKIRVYNANGSLVYSQQGLSNVNYTFGANFLPGIYTLIVEIDGIVQSLQLIKM